MRGTLSDLLEEGRVLLADGATGTNYFRMGLTAGDAPERWNTDAPEQVAELHRRFVDAGADIILTNTFGANRHRLRLHGDEHHVGELSGRGAEIADSVADVADHPVVVAGSVGPTGELFAPLGALTRDDAVETFREQIAALRDGGADVAWIETMSAAEEVLAAAAAAIAENMPFVATCSFDTAGRTMMGMAPTDYPAIFAELPGAPLAIGANCGVGAPDLLVALVAITATADQPVVAKGNCGIPEFHGTEIVYSGTPELMGRYATLAADSGARIVGGCCGTTPEHIAAMRAALDAHKPSERPTVEQIIESVGPLTNTAAEAVPRRSRRRT